MQANAPTPAPIAAPARCPLPLPNSEPASAPMAPVTTGLHSCAAVLPVPAFAVAAPGVPRPPMSAQPPSRVTAIAIAGSPVPRNSCACMTAPPSVDRDVAHRPLLRLLGALQQLPGPSIPGSDLKRGLRVGNRRGILLLRVVLLAFPQQLRHHLAHPRRVGVGTYRDRGWRRGRRRSGGGHRRGRWICRRRRRLRLVQVVLFLVHREAPELQLRQEQVQL